MCFNGLRPPKGSLLFISAFILVLCIHLSTQDSSCSTVLKCKCIGLTYNCSFGGHPIMPIMLNPGLKTLILSHNQIRRIHDLNSVYILIEQLDISHNLLNSNESSVFESEKLKVWRFIFPIVFAQVDLFVCSVRLLLIRLLLISICYHRMDSRR